jgi:hypothetical protein
MTLIILHARSLEKCLPETHDCTIGAAHSNRRIPRTEPHIPLPPDARPASSIRFPHARQSDNSETAIPVRPSVARPGMTQRPLRQRLIDALRRFALLAGFLVNLRFFSLDALMMEWL